MSTPVLSIVGGSNSGKTTLLEKLIAVVTDVFGLDSTLHQFDLSVDLVQTSCGFGVPLYEFASDRSQLNAWAERRGEEGIRAYWQKKTASLDSETIRIENSND